MCRKQLGLRVILVHVPSQQILAYTLHFIDNKKSQIYIKHWWSNVFNWAFINDHVDLKVQNDKPTSSLPILMLSVTPEKTVGWMKYPSVPCLWPPHSSLAPSFFPLSISSRTFLNCSSLTWARYIAKVSARSHVINLYLLSNLFTYRVEDKWYHLWYVYLFTSTSQPSFNFLREANDHFKQQIFKASNHQQSSHQ